MAVFPEVGAVRADTRDDLGGQGRGGVVRGGAGAGIGARATLPVGWRTGRGQPRPVMPEEVRPLTATAVSVRVLTLSAGVADRRR